MKDLYTRKWITANALEIISEYEPGILTVRGLHYRLVARGMTNSMQHYKRVVDAMIEARWSNEVPFETFSDNDRGALGATRYENTDVFESVEIAKDAIKKWMENYWRNTWEEQRYYPEVFIEKKALQGTFEAVTRRYDVALSACKGYPSLTFLYDAYRRMQKAYDLGREPIILYFGDDPSGEDIPRSVVDNLMRIAELEKGKGKFYVKIRRVLLNKEQVVEMKLPPAPIKMGDSRAAKWDGLGQVELDAVEPRILQDIAKNAIKSIFDSAIYSKVKEKEKVERNMYRVALKDYVSKL